MNSSNDSNVVNELVEKIHQFFNHQIESSSELSEAAKESLTVASECIEQAYKVQRKQASPDLLNIYKKHRQQQQQPQASGNLPNLGATLVQNLASSILSQATTGVSTRSAEQPTQATTANVSGTNASAPPQPPPSNQERKPKTRKLVSEAEKIAAESFKNQGNDAMKQDNYHQALIYYTQAIEIDDNNAIYYSNRAAAKSKLADHNGALDDCQEALEIDPNYCKAYGRMGLAYASLDNHAKARDAYKKAVELDPNNESYKNNLKIAEENLSQVPNSGGENPMAGMLRSFMSNPQFAQMAMSLQDPRIHGLITAGLAGVGGLAGALSGAAGNAPTSETNIPNTENPSHQQNSNQQQAGNTAGGANTNSADLFSSLSGGSNIDFMQAGQQLMSTLQSNPELMNNINRVLGQYMQPQNSNNNNNQDQNPPPGYS